MTTDLFLKRRRVECNDYRKHGSPLLRVCAQGLPDLSSLFGILRSYLRKGYKSARSSPMSDDTTAQGPFGVYRCPWSSLLSYWIYRLVGSNFVWSYSQWRVTLSLHRVTRVRRDSEGWRKSVRWHGKGKEKENLRVANLWEATVRGVLFLRYESVSS